MWIVASLPFWFVGGIFSFAGAIGMCKAIVGDGDMSNHEERMFFMGLGVLGFGALCLYIAARIAS